MYIQFWTRYSSFITKKTRYIYTVCLKKLTTNGNFLYLLLERVIVMNSSSSHRTEIATIGRAGFPNRPVSMGQAPRGARPKEKKFLEIKNCHNLT